MPRGKIRLLASASLRRTCGLRRMSTEPKQAWPPQPPLIRGALAYQGQINKKTDKFRVYSEMVIFPFRHYNSSSSELSVNNGI